MKKTAFTLAEILICLVVISVIALVMMKSIHSETLRDKANAAKAFKVIESFDQAAENVMNLDADSCPLGSFIVSVGGGKVIALNNITTAADAMTLFAKYMKFESTGLDFKNYTGYTDDNISKSNVSAAKMSGDTYVGIYINTSLFDCPAYLMPNKEGGSDNVPAPSGKKCWAKLYTDVNGTEGPNTLGQDVYIFGLGESGIQH